MKYNYAPLCSDFGKSLKLRAKEYLRENTLHGIPYAADASRPKWERITWAILTLASIGAIIGIIVTVWDKFQTSPTLTGMNLQTENLQIEFPQVLACYDWAQLDHSSLDKAELYIYEQLYNWTWGHEISIEPKHEHFWERNNFREVFEKLLPNCGDAFTNYSLSGQQQLKQGFTKTLTPVGSCCRFIAPKFLTTTDHPWELAFLASASPLQLYLLNTVDSGPMRGERALVKAYEPVEIQYLDQVTQASSDLRHLTRKQRDCEFNEDTPVSVNNCQLEYMAQELLERCDCVPWFIPSEVEDQCFLSEYACLSENPVDLSKSPCMLGCNNIVHVPSTVLFAAEYRVKLAIWPRTAFMLETRFGYLDLMVSFGGIASLFLGFSLLTTVEVGYYFTLRPYCGAVMSSSRRQHNIVTVHVIAPKTPRKKEEPVYYQYTE